MNTEIQKLIKNITPLGRPDFKGINSFSRIRAYRWQKAMRIWNKTHEPEAATLESIENAFKKKWPCVIAEYSEQGKALRMTIPWIIITFKITRSGYMRGYTFLDNGKKLTADIYMSPSLLTDFLPFIRNIIYTRPEIEDFESRLSTLSTEIDGYISHANINSNNDPLPAWQAINIFEFYYEIFHCLSNLNRYEEALVAIKNVLFYYNLIEQYEERNDSALYSCIIGDGPFPYDNLDYFLNNDLRHTLLSLGRLNEAILSYRPLYNRKLKYVEQNCIWPGYKMEGLDEIEQHIETYAFVHEYCYWIENYCELLSLAQQDKKAIQLLNRALGAIKNLTIIRTEDVNSFYEQLDFRMKVILKGCSTISDDAGIILPVSDMRFLTIDKIRDKLIKALKSFHIDVESFESIREKSHTRFRLHLKPGQDNDIIRKLRCDIAASLGLKSIDVNITHEYAELAIPNLQIFSY